MYEAKGQEIQAVHREAPEEKSLSRRIRKESQSMV